MALYTIADLHLPLGRNKPMDIFGDAWNGYIERLRANWQQKIAPKDTVVIPGDFSWATYLDETFADFEYLNSLNGKKILLKGNHDFWWTTKKKLNEYISANNFEGIDFLQSNCFFFNKTAICGTRGWKHPKWNGFTSEDKKLFDREVNRLEISLAGAKEAEEIYVFTHYPPLSSAGEGNEFVDMMKKYGVSKCFYGHLHGAAHKFAVNGVIDGIEYHLISADYLRFEPYCVKENDE